jgi:hypothetical protein
MITGMRGWIGDSRPAIRPIPAEDPVMKILATSSSAFHLLRRTYNIWRQDRVCAIAPEGQGFDRHAHLTLVSQVVALALVLSCLAISAGSPADE